MPNTTSSVIFPVQRASRLGIIPLKVMLLRSMRFQSISIFLKGFLINEVQSAASIHEYLGKSKAVHYWTEDQCGWCSGCSEFGFITGIKSNSRVTPWVYCCYLVDFGKAAECSFSHII